MVDKSDNEYTLSFEISDTGPGISQFQQEKIFDAFSQADTTTSRRYGGTGLGLAIARKLVQLMGGDIQLDSEPGKGSRFSFTVHMSKSVHMADTETIIDNKLKGIKVLIIDEYPARDILHKQLLNWEVQSRKAVSVEEALEILQQAAIDEEPYKVLIINWHMTGINGQDLIDKIRSNNEISTIKIILLSSTEYDIKAGLKDKISAECILSQPVRQQKLFECLNQIMGHPIETIPQDKLKNRHCSGRILLAEDNFVNQEVAIAMLMSIGCDVDFVENGKAALEAFQKQHYDLILMDCHMPEMDGFTASRAIRETEQKLKRHPVPIIALTADVQKGIQEQCHNAGMDDYLSKPFNKIQLTNVLEHWLPGSVNQHLETPDALSSDSLEHRNNEKNTASENSPTAIKEQSDAIEVIDLSVLEQLCYLSNETGRDILTRSIESFIHQASENMAQMHQALDSGDTEKLRLIAHTMKSASTNLGARLLSPYYAELESVARNNQLSAAQNLLDKTEPALKQFLKALTHYSHNIQNTLPGINDKAPVQNHYTILIVDDDPDFQMNTTDALQAIRQLNLTMANRLLMYVEPILLT